MRYFLLTLTIILIYSAVMADVIDKNNPKLQISKINVSQPLLFTANQGQWDEHISFRSHTNGTAIWFTSGGAYYQFTKRFESNSDKNHQSNKPDSTQTMTIKANFVNSNPNPTIYGIDKLDFKCNYFLGSDQSKWQTDVSNYSAVMYEQVYDGIDLKYFGNGHQLEYDFIVAPGADYTQINIQYDGAESISINNNGELIIKTKWNEVIEQAPLIYQVIDNKTVTLTGSYVLNSDNSFGFELLNYDPTLPLVIDPLLTYSTFIGGTDDELVEFMDVDSSGNVYLTGTTLSADFPLQSAFQGTVDAATFNVFITKINSSGSGLVYSTYLGGNDDDWGTAIKVDSDGNVYLAGDTYSTDFPLKGAYQTSQGGSDVFVTKLNNLGNDLIYSTYVGGSDEDYCVGLDVDVSNSAYITGSTYSTDYPLVGEYQTEQFSSEVFVTKLNSAGNGLIYSTYLGKNGDDYGNGIVVDALGNAYITGETDSPGFPILGWYQEFLSGTSDAFVTKFNATGDSLLFSTFLGGAGDEMAFGIALDDSSNVFVAGATQSSDFPVVSAFMATYQNGWDAFVTKINSTGTTLDYSTYLGGSTDDFINALEVDENGNAFLTGETDSDNFPLEDEYQSYQGGSDAFVTKLNNFGDSLIFSSYLGGSSNDFSFSIALDDSLGIYLTGLTYSSNFPTVGEYQTYQGLSDIFLTKFNEEEPSCCVNPTGDINNDGNVIPDIGDLLYLVDYMFLPPGSSPVPACLEETNVNGLGDHGPDISDLLYLVDYMFLPPGEAAEPVDCL